MKVLSLINDLTAIQSTLNEFHFMFKDSGIISGIRDNIELIARDATEYQEILEQETNPELCTIIKNNMINSLVGLHNSLGSVTITGSDLIEANKLNTYFSNAIANIQSPKEEVPVEDAPKEIEVTTETNSEDNEVKRPHDTVEYEG